MSDLPTHYAKAHKLFTKMHEHTIGHTDTEVFDALAMMVASIEGAHAIRPQSFDFSLRIMRSRIPEAVAASKAVHKKN